MAVFKMSRQERPEISLIVERTKKELRGSLQKTWNRLYWEPEIETPGGPAKGVLIEEAEDKSEIIYLSPSGRILKKSKDKSEEVDIATYLNLALKAEDILKALRAAQWQEIENDPEGKNVLWRPNQFLFGKWYCPYSPFGYAKTDRVITVRAKKDGLYCPKHPNQALITVIAPSENREKFSECPVDGCRFSIFNGI